MMSSRVSGENTYLRRSFRSVGCLLSGSILGVGGWEVEREVSVDWCGRRADLRRGGRGCSVGRDRVHVVCGGREVD